MTFILFSSVIVMDTFKFFLGVLKLSWKKMTLKVLMACYNFKISSRRQWGAMKY